MLCVNMILSETSAKLRQAIRNERGIKISQDIVLPTSNERS